MADDTEMSPSFRGVFAPLRSPGYRRLLVSNTLWWQAMWMEMTVVGWLVLEMTDSAWQVALISFYRMAPLLVVGFFAGPVADRIGRIRTILLCQTATLTVAVTITLLLWTDRLAYWHLAVGAVILGTVWSLTWTARRSLMPDLVGKNRTVDAMILENLSQNVSRILGPLMSGTLIEFLGAWGCYAVLASVSALSLVVLLGLALPPLADGAGTRTASPWTLMVEGLRYVRRSPPILGALLITVVTNYLVFPYHVLLPVFARDILHQGPIGLGLLGAGSGVGSFLGLFIISRVRHTLSNGWIFIGGSLFMSALLVCFSASAHFPLSLALLTLSGAGQACFNVMQSSIVLLSASDEMRSRTMGTLIIAIGAGPPGNLQIGALSETFGSPTALGLTSTLSILFIFAIAAAMPDLRRKTAETDPRP